jgi:hypothetical protein
MNTKIKSFFINHGGIIWALIVALFALLFWFAFRTDTELSQFFSSDSLYLQALYRDFFQDGYTFLDGWTLNQATNIFPDMLLFFLLNAIFGNFTTATFSYAVIQYFAIIFLMYLIFRQIKPKFHSAVFAPAIYLFTSFLFLFFIDRSWIASLLNHNAWHNSAYVMALLCLYLFYKYLKNKSRKTLIAILILSMLCGACDKLFFICFSIPASMIIVILFFFNEDKKLLTKLLITIIIGAILGVALWIFFKNNPYFSLTKPYGEFSLSFIKDSWITFSKQMYGYLTIPSFIMFLTYFSILSYLATVCYVFVNTVRLIKEKKTASHLYSFQLFVLFFTPVVVFTPILAGSYDNAISLRYNYFPYLLLPFSATLLLGNWLNNNKLTRIITNTTLSSLMIGFLLINFPLKEFGKGFNNFIHTYPERTEIIDNYFSDDATCKYGITDDYWLARQATMFSKKNVRLYCAFEGGNPWLHAANKHWFIERDKGEHAHCEFTFLVWTAGMEIPEIFITMNDSIQPVALGEWNLFEVKPYRFIIPGSRFHVEPVLIERSSIIQ